MARAAATTRTLSSYGACNLNKERGFDVDVIDSDQPKYVAVLGPQGPRPRAPTLNQVYSAVIHVAAINLST